MTDEPSPPDLPNQLGDRTSDPPSGLYIVLISVHGLIRGYELELGKDADNGGQNTYVVELTKALAKHPDVGRVELLTRLVDDPKVSDDYKQPIEPIETNAFIVRLPCGPRRYLRKEVLWPHLDTFVDQGLKHFRQISRRPDIIHGHYADAGHIATRLAGILGIPAAFTGHSLGRNKRQRLLDEGAKLATIEKRYNLTRRIEAEEFALKHANFVVTSTRQEIEEQYASYDNYHPKRMVILPPGTDLERYYPPQRGEVSPPYLVQEIERFLQQPKKPCILALARPDPRKNLSTLVQAYGEDESLQALANLVILSGDRTVRTQLNPRAKEVIEKLLGLMDDYDLYGKFAYPKSLPFEAIPELYRYATRQGGVFVNPALTEPFGLTLLEAASSGLPVVATKDGGPIDIVGFCKNGLLIDPLDSKGLAEALKSALSDRKRWRRWSKKGIEGTKRHFSWSGHVEKYIKKVHQLAQKKVAHAKQIRLENHLITSPKVLICDIDNTLIGNEEGLRELMRLLQRQSPPLAFGIATGRHLESAVKILRTSHVLVPDLLITSVGSEIHYGPQVIKEIGWSQHIDHLWNPEAIHQVLKQIPGMRLQGKVNQRQHKISYNINTKTWPGLPALKRHLQQNGIHTNVIFSHNLHLDLLPIRASKGAAVRYIADKWALPFESILVMGDSGNDAEMILGKTLAGVVGNHQPELEKCRHKPHVYFASAECAWGIIETLQHYNFVPD